MVCVAQIQLCEDLCMVQAIQHLGDEGQGEAILHCDSVQAAIVDHQAQLAIWPLYEHDWSCSRLQPATGTGG